MLTEPSALSRDFDSLEVEHPLASSYGRTITEADIVAFSALTGDWHPQHADAVWAAQSDFGERIAHGMLLLSVALGMAQLDADRVVALRGISRARFKAPVRIGDTIRLQGSVDRLRPLDEATGLVDVACRVVNQDGRAVATFVLEVIWRRAANAGAAGEGGDA